MPYEINIFSFPLLSILEDGDSSGFEQSSVLLEEHDLRNLALELFMQDLRPFAAALGIDDTTIDHYRVYGAEQDDKGTVRLVKILSEREGNRKDRVCWTINQIGYFSLVKAFLSGNLLFLKIVVSFIRILPEK